MVQVRGIVINTSCIATHSPLTNSCPCGIMSCMPSIFGHRSLGSCALEKYGYMRIKKNTPLNSHSHLCQWSWMCAWARFACLIMVL